MALPGGVAKRFAKIATGQKKESKELTAYGIAKIQNDITYVVVDGSDILTPVAKAMDALDGDRVLVTIKNHSAIITGNVSKPANSTDSVQVDSALSPDSRNPVENRVIQAAIGKKPDLGITDKTAYRGDHGEIAYLHSQGNHAPENATQNIIKEITGTLGDVIGGLPLIAYPVGFTKDNCMVISCMYFSSELNAYTDSSPATSPVLSNDLLDGGVKTKQLVVHSSINNQKYRVILIRTDV